MPPLQQVAQVQVVHRRAVFGRMWEGGDGAASFSMVVASDSASAAESCPGRMWGRKDGGGTASSSSMVVVPNSALLPSHGVPG